MPNKKKEVAKSNNSKESTGTKETISVEEYEKLNKWYAEEITRRDKIIDDLRKQNDVLLRTSLRQGSKSVEVTSHASSLININKKLREKLKSK
jgi:hypothetical protein